MPKNKDAEYRIERKIWEIHHPDHVEFGVGMSSGHLTIQNLWVRDFKLMNCRS